MATKITATELARNLSDILNRVRYRGESFSVLRNGEVVAELKPTEHKTFTLDELVEWLDHAPPVDEGFVDELRAIRSEQGQLPGSPWES